MEGGRIGYATAKDWQDAMRNNSRYKMHEIIERLGLKANWSSNKRGKTNFDSPLVKTLVTDMSDIVGGLPKEHRELHAFLSAEGSLRDEVESLLKKHGPEIWGRMGPREHLVEAGSPDVEGSYYPKDLFYEEEEDRSLIRVLLHWWMGQKAFNVIFARERMARERKKKEMYRRGMRVGNESPHDAASPLDGGHHPHLPDSISQMQILQHHLGAGSTPASTTSTPPESRNSPATQAQALPTSQPGGFTAINAKPTAPIHSLPNGFSAVNNASPKPASTLSRPASRQAIAPDLGKFVSNFLVDDDISMKSEQHSASPVEAQGAASARSHGNHPAQPGLDPDTLRAFRRYIYVNEDGPECEEELLLHRLETAWRDTVRNGHKMSYGNTTLFAARDRAFLTWIELKRHLAELDRVHKRWTQPSKSPHETAARIMQHRALMKASREVVRSWEEVGQGADALWAPSPSADDLLVQAFVLLAGEGASAELVWAPINIAAVMQWLGENLRQFAFEEPRAESQGQLFYLG